MENNMTYIHIEVDRVTYILLDPLERRHKVQQPLVTLKVPKHEIFDDGFFASKELIWSPDS
jgi:hypothetical protein